MTVEALIFDLGGVVLESPFVAIERFAKEEGLSRQELKNVLDYVSHDGAWAKLERGEITRAAFAEEIEADAMRAGLTLSGGRLLGAFDRFIKVRPRVVEEIRAYRAKGLQVAALTNNWPSEVQLASAFGSLPDEFDVFVESWRSGTRKPEMEIYQKVLDALNVQAERCVFLDDLGRNLKPARTLGMHTIKVVEIDAALEELRRLVG